MNLSKQVNFIQQPTLSIDKHTKEDFKIKINTVAPNTDITTFCQQK
jgi:hypothetical protein